MHVQCFKWKLLSNKKYSSNARALTRQYKNYMQVKFCKMEQQKTCLLYSNWASTSLCRLLFENRPALYFCNSKENKKNNIRMLDTLFIEDFIDIMEEYFHF